MVSKTQTLMKLMQASLDNNNLLLTSDKYDKENLKRKTTTIK